MRFVNGKYYYVGKYKYIPQRNTIIITELPVNIHVQNYTDKLKKNEDDFEDVTDMNNDDDVYIEVVLKPGTLEKIQEKWNSSCGFDSIEAYFKLRKPVKKIISMVREDVTPREFSTYEEVFVAWFQRRKELYKKRFDREIILIKLRILLLENVIRFIDLTANLEKKTKAAMEAIAIQNKLDAFNAGLLDKPKYTPVNELERLIYKFAPDCIDDKINYDYLLNLRVRDFTVEEVAAKVKKLAALKEELAELEKDTVPFIGAETWKREIDEFVTAYEAGWNKLRDE
jgi:DNA gyrase/topoisomerase IV subunit A